MTVTITVFNNKGGVGKSTICWNLADALGRKGKRVLLIDFDPKRFKDANPHFTDFDNSGKPVFAGWIFNGFDTARKRRSVIELAHGAPAKEKVMVQADKTMYDRIVKAVNEDLVAQLQKNIQGYRPVCVEPVEDYCIGDIEDANVLIQNSLWLSVPLAQLDKHKQVAKLQDKQQWADNQKEQIALLRSKIDLAADRVIRLCN